jgi:hypothetical protein
VAGRELNDNAFGEGILVTEASMVGSECLWRQMCIPLGHRDGLVAQDSLQFEQVAPVHHPVTGEGVAQIVETDVAALVVTLTEPGEASGVENAV